MKLNIGTNSRGKPFTLPLDLTTQTVAVLARKGAGKSYTAAVFNEELLDAGQVPVIIDPTGAHWGLKSSADGKSAGYPVVVFGGEHGDLPLEEGAGEATARAIVEQRFPAIIDLSLLRKGQVRRFITPFLETLYRLNREPLMLIVDEADDICPQKPFGDEAQMVGALEDVVKRGRKKGIGCTLITQRPADLAKQVLTQCEVMVAMRLVHPLDLKAVMEWVHVHADEKTAAEMLASLPSLPVGTAWFWSPGWGNIFECVKVRARKTFDSGATPKPGEKVVEPKKRAEIDIAALGAEIAATAERAKANDPKELKAEVARLKLQLAKQPAAQPSKTERVEVPILRESDETKLSEMLSDISSLHPSISKIGDEVTRLASNIRDMRAELRGRIPPTNQPRIIQSAPRAVTPQTHTNGESLPKGERATLIGCAQYPDGVARETLTVLTGYKRSSRDAYIQRLRERGYLDANGDNLVATEAGIAALGADYQPLPTGSALLEHWMARLPEGERKVLAVLTAAYPNSVKREEIDAQTGYQRSSRDAYLQRMSAKRLVTGSRGEVRASEQLFDA